MTACKFAPGCSSNAENSERSGWYNLALAEAPEFVICVLFYLFWGTRLFCFCLFFFFRPTHEARYEHGAPRRRRVLGSACLEPAIQRGRAHGSRRNQASRGNASPRHRALDAALRAACARRLRPVVARQAGSIGPRRGGLAQVRVLAATT